MTRAERPARRLLASLSSGATPSDRACDLAVVAFALWTTCAHGVVLAGGSLVDLLSLVALALLALTALALGYLYRRYRQSGAASQSPPLPEGSSSQGAELHAKVRLAGAGLAALALAGYVIGDDATALWWSVVLLLSLAALALHLGTSDDPIAAARATRGEPWLWLLALGCGGLALAAHRYAADDAFYIAVAVATADEPHQALLSADPLLGVPGMALHNPLHRIHSFEVLNGALSYLSGVSAIRCFHWISAGFAGLLVPLAYARLFRVLTPGAWLPAVLAVVVALIANGDSHRSFGNYAFVRIWQGKAIMLNVALPLIYAYALRFAAKPTARRWALLACAQIAAVGLSSTGLWAAPVAAALALGSAVRPSRRGVAILATGLLTSAYPLCVGMAVKGDAVSLTRYRIEQGEWGAALDNSLEIVLGHSGFELVALASVLAAWLVWSGPARRFAVFVPLGAWFWLLSPYWETFIQQNLTGPSHWRALWALPVPALMGLLFTAPFALLKRRSPPVGPIALYVSMLVALFVVVPERTTIQAAPGFPGRVWLGTPQLKVDDIHYEAALRLSRIVPQGSIVLAPERVSRWIATIHYHPYPLVARYLYLGPASHQLGIEEVTRRRELTRFVEGARDGEDALAQFRQGLEDYAVRGVCLAIEASDDARTVLREAGFVPRLGGKLYEIWARRTPTPET